jgi:hypothetical protein
MERKPTRFKRRYHHHCKAHNNQEQQIPTEICPDCGQRGEFKGYFQDLWTRIGHRTRLLGMPGEGVHLTYLPKMFKNCDTCHGEGIALGDEFDYECPDCDGTGGILILSKPEMDKIRRWANARHERSIIEDEQSSTSSPNIPPENLIVSRDADSLAKGLMEAINYSKKYDERNNHIGEMMLACDDQGWDILMDLIESWENAGGVLDTNDEAIVLKDNRKRNSIVLISLFPPSDKQPQGLTINREQIGKKYGVEAERKFWERIQGFHPSPQGWIPVNEQFTLDNSKSLLNDLILLLTE